MVDNVESDRERDERGREGMSKESEREEKERGQERENERSQEREKEENGRRQEREKEGKESEKLKETEKASKIKTHSKAVGTAGDFDVPKEHRGTQIKATTSNKRTDTKDLIRTEDRAAETAQPIRKCMAKAVQTDQREEKRQQRSVQTMFPSKEEGEDQSTGLKADQRRRLFSLTGRKDEFEEEEAEATTDAWAQCSPPPELCDIGVQTVPIFRDFEVDETVEQLFEDDDEISDNGSGHKERSESVTVTIGEMDDWLDMAYPKRTEKKDLVIQTDDSYLRIARRLDKLRTNRTDLNVYCCTGTNPPQRRKGDGKRKSLRFLDPIRDSFRPRRRSKSPEREEKRAGKEADKCRIETSTLPERPTPKRGRVAQLVATHEQSSLSQSGSAAPSAMASVAGKARKNIRHVRMADETWRNSGDDEGEKAMGDRR